MFGLRDSDIVSISHVLDSYPEVERAYIFGSRAKGNFSNGSDIDIAVEGVNVPFDIILKIAATLNEETMMPYMFDVLDYHAIVNQDLKDHIDKNGVLFYQKISPCPASHN